MASNLSVERHKSASAPAQPPAEEEIPAAKKRPVGRLVARAIPNRACF